MLIENKTRQVKDLKKKEEEVNRLDFNTNTVINLKQKKHTHTHIANQYKINDN